MRPIIDNTKQTIYIKNDHYISQLSKTNAQLKTGDTDLPLINTAGFNDNDFIIVDNLADERSELTQITTITGNTLHLAAALGFDHDNKTNVYRASYDYINLYENGSIISSVAISPDYYSAIATAVNTESYYNITFYNTDSASESPQGESIYGNNDLLCTVADLAKFEDVSPYLTRVIDKIDLATMEIRNKFISQAQDIDSLTNRELLRLPTALLALHYIFAELIKNKDDLPSLKANKYLDMYTQKFDEIASVINKTDDQVSVFGQTIIER